MDYIIKGIDNEVWKAAKIKAIQEDKTMKDVLLKALDEYVEDVRPSK